MDLTRSEKKRNSDFFEIEFYEKRADGITNLNVTAAQMDLSLERTKLFSFS